MSLPVLNHSVLEHLRSDATNYVPDSSLFSLPEKVIQFGTGVLLRGLPDYYIDQANKSGMFGGRIVMIKSTSQGDTMAYESQGMLYTHTLRGIENGLIKERDIINASISRVLSAQTQWEDILDCARKASISIVISNTTEQGLSYQVENMLPGNGPQSFPAKLYCYLRARYEYFNGAPDLGMVIIPTELVEFNGEKLKDYVIRHAKHHQADEEFITWLEVHNQFCNSLVDRIVPGKPKGGQLQAQWNKWKYQDDLCIVSEPYGLWAIEGSERIKDMLTFANVDQGIKIVPDINSFKELKLRLLNGTHSLSCGKALTERFMTVKDAMSDSLFRGWVQELIHEIEQSIPYPLEPRVKSDFAHTVIDRFSNPFIDHYWKDICMNYTLKLKLRVIPLLMEYQRLYRRLPVHILEGLAYYFFILSKMKRLGGRLIIQLEEGVSMDFNDPVIQNLDRWNTDLDFQENMTALMQDKTIWGTDLTQIEGFVDSVNKKLIGLRG